MCFLKATQRSRNFTYTGRRARLLRVSPCQSHYELVAESLYGKPRAFGKSAAKKGGMWLPRQYLALRPVRIRLDIASGNWGTLWEGRCRTYRSSLQETRQLDLGKHCPIASHLLLKLFPRPSLHGSCRLLCCRLVRSVSPGSWVASRPSRPLLASLSQFPQSTSFAKSCSWLLDQWWLGFHLLRWLSGLVCRCHRSSRV